MAEPEKVTEAQAGEALRALVAQAHDDDDEPVAAAAEPEPDKPEPTPDKAATEEPAEPIAASGDGDDVASLKKRLEERDAQLKQAEELHTARTKALQERQQQNERILRDRFLRKSTAADKALKTLRATRTEQGIPEADVDRVIQEIESTMHPQSSTYVAPAATEYSALGQEDQAIVLNAFLNEKGMTNADAEEFGKWIRGDGATVLSEREQDMARRGEIDGFLRVAHVRYLESMREQAQRKKSDAVSAVQVVQRAQRDAARAATSVPAATRKPANAPKSDTPDWKKMTEAERHEMVSALLKQSVEQYR